MDECPQLAIAYKSGHVQLMKNQYDISKLQYNLDLIV